MDLLKKYKSNWLEFLIIDIIDFIFDADAPDGGRYGWRWILWQKGRVQEITPQFTWFLPNDLQGM